MDRYTAMARVHKTGEYFEAEVRVANREPMGHVVVEVPQCFGANSVGQLVAGKMLGASNVEWRT